jgi:hypothetical protein
MNGADPDTEGFYKLLEDQIVYPSKGVDYAADRWRGLQEGKFPSANKYPPHPDKD